MHTQHKSLTRTPNHEYSNHGRAHSMHPSLKKISQPPQKTPSEAYAKFLNNNAMGESPSNKMGRVALKSFNAPTMAAPKLGPKPTASANISHNLS